MIRTDSHIPAYLPFALTAFFLTLLNAVQGGYFPTSWGWSSVAALLVIGLWTVAARGSGITRIELVEIGLLVLLFGWTLLSAAWSGDVGSSVHEAERTLVALGVVAAILLVFRAVDAPAIVAGVLGAITLVCAYAAATRVFPRHFGNFRGEETYRLSVPIGYWNGLGLFAAMGALLALGVVASRWPLAVRAAAAATLPINLTALYFSFSRGGWLALGFGVAVTAACTPWIGRLAVSFLATTPVAAVVIWYAGGLPALTHRHTTLAAAAADGSKLAVALVLGSAAALGAVLLLDLADRRGVPVERIGRLLAAGTAAAVVAVGAIWVVSHPGQPGTFLDHARRAFAGADSTVPTDLNQRLFTLSSSGREHLWGVAWRDFRAHPLTGSGAGTFERTWLADPGSAFYVRDAHSLYLETLAELGFLGLLLVGAALLIPLVVAVRRRGAPVVAIAAGAYAAYLLHAAADWDWELPGVTCAALALGAALLVGTRTGRADSAPMRSWVRLGVGAALVPLVAFALVGWLGNEAAASAQSAIDKKQWARAEQEAGRANRLMPWSADPPLLAGQAYLAAGDLVHARASYREAIRRNPRNWEAWLNLAVASRGNARRQAWVRAKQLYPNGQQIALAKITFDNDAEAARESRQKKR